ncbi:hypothetical protein PIB30_077826 [Stylosanthes scabra]|uniref:Aminotransferase-like plant mobile domain-containing protein n=1 Tax=Stylosanthes scabra TaxID=79078 RepID=A0ABU6XT71_9FABA|nr:hypothetical protein [Stylosanthes scabra]
MHHIDRVIRQYGGEQPVPRLPIDVTRHISSTGCGDDVWWPDRLSTWYDGWRRRRSPEVLLTVHFEGDPRGTQQYYEWYARVARRGRFLSRTADLVDPRWTLAPAGIPAAAVHPRDDLVMPDDALTPRWRQAQEPRPRQAAPVRGKLSRRDQRRRLRMVEVGAAAHVAEELAEEQQEYDQHGPWVPTYSSPPAMGFPVFDPSRIGSEYATPPSYQTPSSYHSQSFHGHSAPFPSTT